jgi:2,4-didehydro-3-deoxy-L-rhamnonate hydrolase
MSKFGLCTYGVRGFQGVGIVIDPLGDSPTVLDLERCSEWLNIYLNRHDLLRWPKLTMQHALNNWDIVLEQVEIILSLHSSGAFDPSGIEGLSYSSSEVRFLPPISFPPKILNAGANYYDHIAEMGTVEIDPERDVPYFFPKTPNSSVIGDKDTIVLPHSEHWSVAQYSDWEVELAVVIGRRAKDVSVADADKYIAGYTIYQDISGRDKMIREEGPFPWDWHANKCNDTFAPMGPWIIPANQLGDVSDLGLKSSLNGEVQQDSSTAKMIWTVQELLSCASAVSRLEPGDVIATGTCAGVGMAQGLELKPGELPDLFPHMLSGGGRFLAEGDELTSEIQGIGKLTNYVSAKDPRIP